MLIVIIAIIINFRDLYVLFKVFFAFKCWCVSSLLLYIFSQDDWKSKREKTRAVKCNATKLHFALHNYIRTARSIYVNLLSFSLPFIAFNFNEICLSYVEFHLVMFSFCLVCALFSNILLFTCRTLNVQFCCWSMQHTQIEHIL